jgi:ribosomal-protein-alanine N-acetyltransferase
MKIELRKFKMSDLREVTTLFANDNVLKNLNGSLKAKDMTLSKEKKWLKNLLKNYKKKKPDSFSFAIVVDDVLVGSIGAPHIDWDNQKTEMGYWIGEPYWGKGYATEAIKLFVQMLFKKYKFMRIEAVPYSYNIASQRVLEKAGFMFEGERRMAVKKGNKFLDDKLYARVK